MKKVIFALLALVIVSCGSSKTSREEIVELSGVYLINSIQGEDVTTKNLSFTFTPSENRITGDTGCNGFSAQYLQENNVLSIGRAMSTRMFCEGKMETEQNIITKLEDVSQVRKNGNGIVLYSTENQSLFSLTKR